MALTIKAQYFILNNKVSLRFMLENPSHGHDWGDGNHQMTSVVNIVLSRDKAKKNATKTIGKLSQLNMVSDLSKNIGSLQWFTSLFALILLIILNILLLPSINPLKGAQQPAVEKLEFEQARAQMVMPLAYGADSGSRMAATGSVLRLRDNPERPNIELTATIGRGENFLRVLRRAGIGLSEARTISALIAKATPIDAISSGTPIDIRLGRRSTRNSTRPVENLSFRARFDLDLTIQRYGDTLALKQNQIKVDNTPLRIKGKVGRSLYRSARAAGVEADKVQQFLRAISQKLSLSKMRSSDEFDIIIEHKRAATGETQVGDLIYAAIERGGKPHVQLLKWQKSNATQWFEASGVGETIGSLLRPVPGRVTSGFGRRRHPVLGYVRMHNGIDFSASYGTPIRAASDGRVTYSGRNGGAGKFVKIKHDNSLSTGYAHMSRIAVNRGKYVRRGQIIGYVGSTGLSTGPHLHYILYRNGRPINPTSIKFSQTTRLTGQELTNFKSKLNQLQSVVPGAALVPLQSETNSDEPLREIEKLNDTIAFKPKDNLFFPIKPIRDSRRNTNSKL